MPNLGLGLWFDGKATSLMVCCADQAAIDHFWERLTDGGAPGMPMHKLDLATIQRAHEGT